MRDSGQGGFTLVEVMVAAAVVAVGVLGAISAMSSTLQLATTSRETQVAISMARHKVELLRDYAANITSSAGFGNMYTLFNGTTFAVPGLNVPSGMSACGQYTFLSEPQAGTALGYPAGVDLNGNGLSIDALTPPYSPTNPTPSAFPIKVTVTWASEKGGSSSARQRAIELMTVIANAQ